MNSYEKLGYEIRERVIGNLDKCSRNSDSKVVNSPWGVFRMYKSNDRGRFYSLSGSTVFVNRGSLKIGTIRLMLANI